jgi:hypothetical protein
MASSKKTYDTDSIVLRRILALNPLTNGRISANTVLVTGSKGVGSFQDTVGFLSTLGVPTSIKSLGQIYNSTILVAGTNITFSSNANQITINGGSGIAATDLTSTTMGLGTLGYLSTTQLVSTIVNLGQIYNSTILVAGTNITFSSNVNQITINGEAGGGGGIAATDLTSTTMGLGTLGYLSTTQLASTIVNLGQIYNSTILVAGTNITFNSNANEITINSEGGGGGGLSVTDLTSTTIGLATLGYLSSFNTISSLNISSGSIYASFVSSQNITASSIRANRFVGDGSLITNITAVGIVLTVTNSGASAYVINGANNPTLFFIRGHRYIINVNASGHPFWIQTSSGAYNSGNIYNTGITNNGTQNGTIIFEVPYDAPQLYYVCQYHSAMAGSITVLSYLSSFNTISSLNISSGSIYASLLSSQQITASSITANKFVGDGSLITNVPNLGVTSITAGTGIGVDTTTGAVTVSNSGVLSIEQGEGISITGSEGSYTITATGGTSGTIATADMVSTVIGIQLRATSSLTSSLQGLSYMGYLSSFATISSLNISTGSIYASLLSSQQITVSSIRANKFVGDGSLLVNVPGTGGLATTDLTSTVTGLGTSGYLSSLTLLSTIENLGQIYNSTILVAGTNIAFSSNMNQITINGNSGGIELPALVSSIEGLGTLQYISSTQLISSIEGLGFMGNLQLTSSIEGLGSILYLSSFNVLSTLNMSSGSVFTSTMSTTETNAGRLNFGTLYNNGVQLVDQNGNFLFSFQTL